MPEAPQIRLLVQKLQIFTNQRIVKAVALTNDLNLNRLEGEIIKEFTVFGKQILIILPKFAIRVHLMMFGRVKIDERNEGGKLRLGLRFKDRELNFYACDIHFIDKPLNEVFDWTTDVMNREWNAQKALIKLKDHEDDLISDVLIDQEIFNGFGNKGVNEALYRTKVHPASIVKALSTSKKKSIIKAAVEFSLDYFQWESDGLAKANFSVYMKKKCPVHGTALKHKKIGTSGRKCHFCDDCQKLYI